MLSKSKPACFANKVKGITFRAGWFSPECIFLDILGLNELSGVVFRRSTESMKGTSPVSMAHFPLLSIRWRTASSKVRFSLCLNQTGIYLDKLQCYSTSTLTFSHYPRPTLPVAMFSTVIVAGYLIAWSV